MGNAGGVTNAPPAFLQSAGLVLSRIESDSSSSDTPRSGRHALKQSRNDIVRQVNAVAGSKAQNGIAAVNGARIAYDVAGSGPPVLLLHAGIGDRRMWDAQVPAFAEHFTVIRFDARGFGETRKPDAPFSLTRTPSRSWIISGSRGRMSSASPWGARRPSRRRSPRPSGSRPSSPSRRGPGRRCRRPPRRMGSGERALRGRGYPRRGRI